MSGEHYLNLMGKLQNSSFQLSNLLSDLPIFREEKGSYEEQMHLPCCKAKCPTRVLQYINLPVPMWSLPKTMVKSNPGWVENMAEFSTLDSKQNQIRKSWHHFTNNSSSIMKSITEHLPSLSNLWGNHEAIKYGNCSEKKSHHWVRN